MRHLPRCVLRRDPFGDKWRLTLNAVTRTIARDDRFRDSLAGSWDERQTRREVPFTERDFVAKGQSTSTGFPREANARVRSQQVRLLRNFSSRKIESRASRSFRPRYVETSESRVAIAKESTSGFSRATRAFDFETFSIGRAERSSKRMRRSQIARRYLRPRNRC